MADLFAWLVAFFLLIAELGLLIVQLMSLADLHYDYTNPYETTKRVNEVVVPEFVTHGLFCFVLLLTGHWYMFLWCTPILYYNYRLYTKKRHLIDVTEVFRHLRWETKSRIFKIVNLILALFSFVLWMIWTIKLTE